MLVHIRNAAFIARPRLGPWARRGALALALAGLPAPGWSQAPIEDNSFLIEEAYNQERGVVQHISTFSRVEGSGDWLYTFTQEWPVPDERHQLGFTVPVQEVQAATRSHTGLGDLAINYRFQAVGMEGGPLAVAPRLSLLAPTGSASKGLGEGGLGLQVNLPVSRAIGSRFVTHWNAGFTRTFRAQDARGRKADTNSLFLGQSVVWLAAAKVNFLVETAWARSQSVAGTDLTEREDSLLLIPGVRWAHDFSSGLQIVPGAAFLVGVGPSRGEHAVFVYLSFEHPFRRQR